MKLVKIIIALTILSFLMMGLSACVGLTEDTALETTGSAIVSDETTEPSASDAPTDFTTEPSTDPVPDDNTKPDTNPATQPATQPPTNPPTEPATQPPTDPPTEPATQPPTNPPTEPATQPPTEPPHIHSYSAATCTQPRTCSCGATDGEPLGHSYANGTCTHCGASDPDYNETTYVLNTSTKKFHKPSCSRLPTKNRKDTSMSRDEIIEQGYSPCGYCHP